MKIVSASKVPVGSAYKFDDAASGSPAFVLQPKKGTYLAYSAVCTHQGCIVDWDAAASDFACACHGAIFSDTGDVVRGPARDPLAPITVIEYAGDIYTV